MRRLPLLPLLALVAMATACAADGAGDEVSLSGDDLLDGKTDSASEQLRPRLPVVRLEPGVWLEHEVLLHSVVTAEVSLSGLFSVEVDVQVPRDFYTEVGVYKIGADQGRTVSVDIAGRRTMTLVKRIGAIGERTEPQIFPDNRFAFVPDATGDYLLMVVPTEIEPGADREEYGIAATLAETPAQDAP